MGHSTNLSTQQSNRIMQKILSALNKKGNHVQGTIDALATKFEVNRRTITRLWQEVKKHMIINNTVINLNNKRIGREAPNKIEFDREKFKCIKTQDNSTLSGKANGNFTIIILYMEEEQSP